jgi:hypothetical protein
MKIVINDKISLEKIECQIIFLDRKVNTIKISIPLSHINFKFNASLTRIPKKDLFRT